MKAKPAQPGDPDAQRQALKARGWRRHSRVIGGKDQEFWQAPWNGNGYPPGLVSLASALRIAGLVRTD